MDLRILKKKMFLIINLDREECIRGNVFLDLNSPSHFGEELLIDFLNDQEPFFAIEIEGSVTIRLVHRKNILWVTVPEAEDEEERSGRKEAVTIVLVDGRRFFGHLMIEQPEYKSRVVDFFNAQNCRFFTLTAESETYYINLDQVSQVIPD